MRLDRELEVVGDVLVADADSHAASSRNITTLIAAGGSHKSFVRTLADLLG
jgi:hypothetical protein